MINEESRKLNRKDLKSAFGKKWNNLPKEKQESILDKIEEIFEKRGVRNEKETEDAFKRISDTKWGMGLVFVGLLLGISGSLIANSVDRVILDRFFDIHPNLYITIVVAIGIFAVWFINRFFQKKIIDEMYRRNNILNSLLELTKESGGYK